jgi:small subunit ribosomal protein S6
MAEATPAASTTAAPAAPAVTHAPGIRLREYETIFLVRPDLAQDLLEKVVDRMRTVVHRDGGKVIKVVNMGKKKTAFEVKKHPRAIFIQFHYLGDSKQVAEFERNLRMTDDVLKYQSVKLAENIDPSARAVEADVTLPGDPEVPDRPAREEFGGGEFRERSFEDRAPAADEADVPEAE